jgi:hypothetical protein
MTGIVDLIATATKHMVVLTDDGSLWMQADVGLEHASKPQGSRPKYGWKRIDGPPVRVTRLVSGTLQNLVVIGAGGRAYERLPDTDNTNNPFLKERFYWALINPPEAPAAPVAKAPADAPQRRTEIAGSWTRNVAGSWEFDLVAGSYQVASTVNIKLERLSTDGQFKKVTLPADNGFQIGGKTTFRASNEASGIFAIYRILGE